MKKNILVIGGLLAALGLSALGLMNWKNNPSAKGLALCQKDTASAEKGSEVNPFSSEIAIKKPDLALVYNVSSRFNWTILKSDLLKAKSVRDVFPPSSTEGIDSFYETEVNILPVDEGEVGVLGVDEQFNEAQLKLLSSTNYSDNFFVQARFKTLNPDSGKEEHDYIVYYTTILPEKAAKYSLGYDALIDYLKEGSKDAVEVIDEDKLKPGRINFTITTSGEVSQIEMDSSCGYPSIDESLIQLVGDMPGNWNPAINANGEKVEQKLVFFFGREGC